MNSKNFNLTNNSNLSTNFSNGFTSGASIGHYINDKLSTEISWTYTTNDHNGVKNESFINQDGNYASNIIGFTGYYNLNDFKGLQPYVGLSLLLAQEIDIDFESNNIEQSYSTGGNLGYGLTIGSKYKISNKYIAFADLQYSYFSGLDLKHENATGKISDIDYNPFALRVGLSMNF